jgi:hypothetical protein
MMDGQFDSPSSLDNNYQQEMSSGGDFWRPQQQVSGGNRVSLSGRRQHMFQNNFYMPTLSDPSDNSEQIMDRRVGTTSPSSDNRHGGAVSEVRHDLHVVVNPNIQFQHLVDTIGNNRNRVELYNHDRQQGESTIFRRNVGTDSPNFLIFNALFKK